MSAIEKYPGGDPTTASARSAAAVSPHDTNQLAYVTKGIYVGGTGDVVCILADDSSAVTFKAVPAGFILPVRAKVVTTASTATYMVALF